MLGQKGPFSVLDQRKGSFHSVFGTFLHRTKKESKVKCKKFHPYISVSAYLWRPHIAL